MGRRSLEVDRRTAAREGRGSNLGAGEFFHGRKSLADSENGWMDARARSRARTRVADAQDCLFRSDREKDRSSL